MYNTTNNTQDHAIQIARQIIEQRPVYIDTETTGIGKEDEIVEISIIDFDGKLLSNSLIKPTKPIPADAQNVHHISNKEVASAPAWPIAWPRIRSFLYGRSIVAYNAPFDYRMMQQSHARYRLPWKDTLQMLDALPLYSDYRGVWDPARRSMKYFKLEEAGAYFQIPLLNEHRAEADALLVRAVVHCIAGVAF